MALTPYPSLATLPEVIANGGKLPALSIDAFASRTIYASSIPGVVLDCDVKTGIKIGGGTPTDNSAAINAVLAKALATNPIHLIVDGGCAIGGPLLIPPAGHVTISGHGWDTGFFVLSGSTCNAIQNVPDTDIAVDQTWQPSARPQAVAGSNVTLRDFRIHCNRGVYPNGNCNGTKDKTVTVGTYSPDARGNYPDRYFYSGVVLKGLENVRIDNLNVYDAPTFHINIYHCTQVWVTRCRIEAGNPAVPGNSDGIHINGGCSSVWLMDNWLASGDDAIALNLEEGDGSAGSDFLISGNVFANCHAGVRVYGQTIRTRRVSIEQSTAFGVWDRFLNVGNESSAPNATRDVNASITVDGLDFQSNGARALAWVNGNVGLLEMRRVSVVEPTSPSPLVLMDHNAIVSSMVLGDFRIHRNGNGSGAGPLLSGSAGCRIGTLSVSILVTEEEGQTYPDIPKLIDLANLTVGRAGIEADVSGVATLLDIPSSAKLGSIMLKDITHKANNGVGVARTVVSAAGSPVIVSVGRHSSTNVGGIASGAVKLTGPGILPSGLPVADALMGDASLYLGSDHGNVPCVKVGGTAKTLNLS